MLQLCLKKTNQDGFLGRPTTLVKFLSQFTTNEDFGAFVEVNKGLNISYCTWG